MKKNILFVVLLLSILTWPGCKDFVSKKISNDHVTVMAPANNTVTSDNHITFWWEPLDGADNYNLQIVMPSFANIQQLITDTTVSGSKLQLSLLPGVYQWRIRGVNGGGTSKLSVFNLTIDTTSNLGGQLVVPIGPGTGFVSGAGALTFSWSAVNNATQYNLQINSSPAVDVTIPNTSYTSTFSAGTYTWKVRALNAFSISQFNTPRGFKIDLSSPVVPNNLVVSGSMNSKVTDTLKWRRNAADVSFDSVFVYEDAALAVLGGMAAASASRIPISALLAVPTASQFVPYWWRVRSVDSVGNRSAFSATGTFTLTP